MLLGKGEAEKVSGRCSEDANKAACLGIHMRVIGLGAESLEVDTQIET